MCIYFATLLCGVLFYLLEIAANIYDSELILELPTVFKWRQARFSVATHYLSTNMCESLPEPIDLVYIWKLKILFDSHWNFVKILLIYTVPWYIFIKLIKRFQLWNLGTLNDTKNCAFAFSIISLNWLPMVSWNHHSSWKTKIRLFCVVNTWRHTCPGYQWMTLPCKDPGYQQMAWPGYLQQRYWPSLDGIFWFQEL